VQIAKLSANPIVIKPGKYTVILEPSAVLDLVSFLWPNFTGTSFIDQDSCFLDKLGQQVLGSNINIWDNAMHPLQWGCPYDGEGMPKTAVKLVENGVLKNLVYGRRSARQLGVTPTGHAAAQPSEIDEDPENFVIEGGTTSLEEMIASTEYGLLIPRVWYVRDVDEAVTKLLTGMTRDGLFLIENGKIVSGIQNMRFNQSLIAMLKNVVAMSPAVLASGEEGSPQVVPAMKVEDFEFTAGTKF
jgi:predicted Zn-dependent protease